MADSSRTVEAVGKISDGTGTTAKNVESMAVNSEKFAQNMEKASAKFGSGQTVGGMGGGVANNSSSSTPTTAGGFGSGGTGGGLFGSGQTPYTSPMPAGQNYVGSGGFGRSMVNVGKAIGAASNLVLAGADILPTTQEAVYTDLYKNRLQFYGVQGGGSIQGINSMGTATSPLDAIMAAGSGAQMGLLPGLENYMSSNFGGVMGGAALLSNLVPGAGLQSGMTGMAALNVAGNVNRLRMLGINVRNPEGTSMNNLPQIIEQLYGMLKKSAGGRFTARDIAVSAMSGNALDSILNQYFAGDPTLRQGIIAGLIQRATTDTYLGESGTQASLVSTGGFTMAAGGIAERNAAEYSMIENISKTTLQGMNRANARLTDLYGRLGRNDAGMFSDLFESGVAKLAEFKASFETLAGGRSGAVGGMFDALSNSGSAFGGIGTLLTSLFSTGLQGGLLLTAPEGGNASTGGVLKPPSSGSNLVVNVVATTTDPQALGITIGNEINKELLMQLAAAKM